MPILQTETVTWTRNLQIHCIQGATLTYVNYHSVLRLKGERALQRSTTRVHQRRNMRRRGRDGNQDGRRQGCRCKVESSGSFGISLLIFTIPMNVLSTAQKI